MMKGIFQNERRITFFKLLLPFAAIVLTSFGIAGLLRWREESVDNRFVILFMFCLGILSLLFFLYLTHPYGKGELSVDEDTIHLNAGPFSKLDCNLSEVSGVHAYRNGMLTISLRSGKQVSAVCLKNQWKIEGYINRVLTEKYRFKDKTSVAEIERELDEKTKERKEKLTGTFICLGLMILYLVICLIFTG